MIVLVSGGTVAVRATSDRRIGQLIVPLSGNSPEGGKLWAADNGAFSGFNPDRFLLMLDRLHVMGIMGIAPPLFITVPDVVGDAQQTLASFWQWLPALQPYRFPLAFVLQDGQAFADVPWRHISAVFVGGSTEFKLGRRAATLVGYAKAFGKWAHMGRVNSRIRLRYAHRIGCDSIDGTAFSRFSSLYVPRAIDWMDEIQQQPTLF